MILFCINEVNAQQINRFMIASDAHHYSPSPDFSQTILYEIVLAAIHEQVDFIFFTGDLVVRGFDSPAEKDSVLKDIRFVLDTLYQHKIRVFACRGNNDAGSREAWDSLFSGIYLFPQNGPENEKNLTYAIEYDNLLFISLDQYTESERINQVWLDVILTGKSRDYIFVAGHEPAFKLYNSNCLGAYPDERNLFWESITVAEVRAYFCGHDHFYDHTIIDDGDGNPNNDIHQVISGTAGASFASDSEYNGNNGPWTPVRLFHEEEYGYVLVDINDSETKLIRKHRVEKNVFELAGDSFLFSSIGTISKRIVSSDLLLRNTPNPFHSKTVISYDLPESSEVELNVYDLPGRKIATLLNELQPAGNYKQNWNAENWQPGIYICELRTGQGRQVSKMIKIE